MSIFQKFKNEIFIVFLLAIIVWFSFFGNLEKHFQSNVLALQQIIPTQIDEWKLVRNAAPKEIAGLIFINEMFQGLYYHPVHGYLGLTVEYSSDSRRKYELHFPDICHAARGDRVIKFPSFEVRLDSGRLLPVALLSWEYKLKSERALCAYWYVVGAEPSISTLRLKIKQIFAGILNRPEDTVLVRIDRFYKQTLSNAEKEKALVLLKGFIEALYFKMLPHSRGILYGT